MDELGPLILHRCNVCGKHFSLYENELTHSEEEGRYITCSYKGKHKNINVVNKFQNAKECMNNRVYVKEGRRIRQLK